MSENEKSIVLECMCAALKGNFFWDDEFFSLLGVHRKELEAVIEKWPNVDHRDEITRMSVIGSMLNLLCYPHHKFDDEWHEYISVSPAKVKEVLDRVTT